MLSVKVHSDDPESLRELVRTHSYDYGCKPLALPDEKRGFSMPAFLTPEEYEEVRDEGYDVEVVFDELPVERTASVTIGEGDRWEDGARAPQGLGSRGEGGGTHVEGGIMNVDEIGTAIKGLVNEYGLPTFSPPHATAGGAGGGGGMVGGVNPDDYHVYFIAGEHARERGGPDQLIYFIADLLHAQRHGTGLHYGSRSFSNADVLKALRTGIVFFPLVNPDGVRWDQQTDSMWRKNRNPASAIPDSPESVGVDINRNYDFLWDFRTHFDPTVASSWSLASEDPKSPQFHGTAPFSEPESRNVAWVFDQFPAIRWYMDIHSAYADVLYSWGSDDNQVVDPNKSFRNPGWNGKRGVLGVDDYKEWIDKGDLERATSSARRVAGAMQSVGGRTYGAIQSSALYPTSGASDDYAFSRSHSDPAHNKVYAFTMEFGRPYHFYPTVEEFDENVLDTGAGFMEFCLAASDLGVV